MEAKENLQNGGSTLSSVHGWPGGMNKMNSNTNKILGTDPFTMERWRQHLGVGMK
jgi:hypothetical protein